jgi:N-methylhydantoinase A/oxoprolinase/acetone carboxylase beta subunit
MVDMITGAEDEPGTGAQREVLTEAGTLAVPVAAGLGDPTASPVSGPAFLRAPDTTIFVPPDWSVGFTAQGYGILNRGEPA